MGVKLIDNKEKVIAALRVQLANNINGALALMVSEAQNNANVDTGFMRSKIGITVPATPGSLWGEMRSLAHYSLFQDVGRWGNMFFSKAFLVVRERFPRLMASNDVSTAGAGVIRAARQEYHGPLGSPRGGKP